MARRKKVKVEEPVATGTVAEPKVVGTVRIDLLDNGHRNIDVGGLPIFDAMEIVRGVLFYMIDAYKKAVEEYGQEGTPDATSGGNS